MDLQNKITELGKEWLPFLVFPVSIYVAYKALHKIIPGAHNLPKLDVKNKVVVITGASSGLGKSLAFELQKRGAKVILLARSVDKLKQICEEMKDTFPLNTNEPISYYFDINDVENGPWNEIAKVDILINNAGISNRGSIEETPIEVHRNVMETNFFGHVSVIQKMLPKMTPDGCIVATSSVQGKLALPYRSSYSSSKHALQAFCDSLRAEYKNRHVLVVSAGYINTGFGAKALDTSGNPVGIEDENQKKGYSSEYCAKKIADAIRDRKSDYVLAAANAKLAVFLRYVWPTLCNYVLHARAANEPWSHKKKL